MTLKRSNYAGRENTLKSRVFFRRKITHQLHRLLNLSCNHQDGEVCVFLTKIESSNRSFSALLSCQAHRNCLSSRTNSPNLIGYDK